MADGGDGGEKESSVPELCSLESVCRQACVYRHIARCVFTTIFINHKYSCSGVFNFILLNCFNSIFLPTSAHGVHLSARQLTTGTVTTMTLS